MAEAVIAPMPVVVLYYNCTAVFEAIDATTGGAVSGVKVTDPAVYGVNLSRPASDQTDNALVLPPPLLVPISQTDETVA